MIASYERHSPSKLNLFNADPAMFFLQYVLGEEQPVNALMARGSGVEDGVTHGLTDLAAPVKECAEVALTTYDGRMALSGDLRREKCRDTIPDMVATALTELRLGCTTFSGLGAKLLGELTHLERLSLAGSGITDNGLTYLHSLNNLQELDLTGTKVTAAGVATLQKALPTCRIKTQ